MKKNLKLVLAILLAAMMLIASISSLAEDPVSPVDLIGGLNVNGNLKVSGLDSGDKVTYYQILKWDPDNSITGADGLPIGWVWGDDIKSGHSLTNDDLKAITGTTDGSGQITAALAGKIAANVGAGKGPDAVTGTEWTKTVDKAGLYMVIVTPKVAGTIYNPIFVAANWYADEEGPDDSNKISIVIDESSYSDHAMAKKSKIPLDKEAIPVSSSGDGYNPADTYNLNDGNPYSGDVGETYEFKVTSTIPKFADNYTKPVFKLNDTLTKGLEFQSGSIKVWLVNDNDPANAQMPAANYTLTENGTSGWTIVFNKDYLQSANFPAAGQKIKVTYLAKVTNDAEKIYNPDKNDVDLYFSTTPDDSEGHGLLRDETNHFTYSIDALVDGGYDWEESSNEAIKVGVDKNGNVIVSTSHDYWGDSWHGPLQGAEFKLYTDSACTKLYKSEKYPDGCTVYSDKTGRITILGLDAGDYWLKETKAPTGYIKQQDAVKVTITPTIDTNVTVKEELEANGTKVEVTYITNKLLGWSVVFNDDPSTGTTYKLTNKDDGSQKPEISRSPSSSDKELVNTKGVELPSTGGMGTTIFYVGGSILVLAAAILLVTKRRMGVED